MDIVEQLYKRLEDSTGRIGEMAFKKVRDILQKNTGYQELKLVSKVLQLIQFPSFLGEIKTETKKHLDRVNTVYLRELKNISVTNLENVTI